jgi:hypothetical protein
LQKKEKRYKMIAIIPTNNTTMRKMSTCAMSNISTSSDGVPKICTAAACADVSETELTQQRTQD